MTYNNIPFWTQVIYYYYNLFYTFTQHVFIFRVHSLSYSLMYILKRKKTVSKKFIILFIKQIEANIIDNIHSYYSIDNTSDKIQNHIHTYIYIYILTLLYLTCTVHIYNITISYHRARCMYYSTHITSSSSTSSSSSSTGSIVKQ